MYTTLLDQVRTSRTPRYAGVAAAALLGLAGCAAQESPAPAEEDVLAALDRDQGTQQLLSALAAEGCPVSLEAAELSEVYGMHIATAQSEGCEGAVATAGLLINQDLQVEIGAGLYFNADAIRSRGFVLEAGVVQDTTPMAAARTFNDETLLRITATGVGSPGEIEPDTAARRVRQEVPELPPSLDADPAILNFGSCKGCISRRVVEFGFQTVLCAPLTGLEGGEDFDGRTSYALPVSDLAVEQLTEAAQNLSGISETDYWDALNEISNRQMALADPGCSLWQTSFHDICISGEVSRVEADESFGSGSDSRLLEYLARHYVTFQNLDWSGLTVLEDSDAECLGSIYSSCRGADGGCGVMQAVEGDGGADCGDLYYIGLEWRQNFGVELDDRDPEETSGLVYDYGASPLLTWWNGEDIPDYEDGTFVRLDGDAPSGMTPLVPVDQHINIQEENIESTPFVRDILDPESLPPVPMCLPGTETVDGYAFPYGGYGWPAFASGVVVEDWDQYGGAGYYQGTRTFAD